MILAIVGSRDYPDLDGVRAYVKSLPSDTTVVSGAARGVDRVAAAAARERGLEVIEYPADWDTHGRAAGFLRNEMIVAMSEKVTAFWDGESRGTAHTIRLAQTVGKPVDIRRPPNE